MTTHRPTEADGTLPPEFTTPAGADPTALLPDEATLTRLAAQFFSALPTAPVGVQALGPVAPAIPAAVPNAPVGTHSPGTAASPVTVPRSPVGPQVLGTGAPGVPTSVPDTPVPVSRIPPEFESAIARAIADTSAPQAVSATPANRIPPGGPTPPPTVPGWETTGAGASDRLPALDVPLAPDRFGLATAHSVTPAFYFLSQPEPGAVQRDSSPLGLTRDTGPLSAGRFPPFDVYAIRDDFPILRERVHGQPLIWFDNGATTQKPRAVIDRLSYFYEHENSNIHRAAHELAARATDAYEGARGTVARFLNASSAADIIFVRGTTEGINLIAQTWGRKHIRAGDEIVISHLEHHANIVPWHLLAAETGAVLRVIPVDDSGQIRMDEYTRLLSDRTKLVSVTQVSNALGTITPVRQIVAEAHRAGAITLVDGAQSVPHTAIDVQEMDTDFFVFSGHKLFGPTGIGAVYGKPEVLQDLPPWQGGGNMISDVTLERSLFQPAPGRFEAGTGNIADAVGLGAAIEYVERIGMDTISRYEHELLAYATPRLAAIPGVRLIGTAADKASVLSFTLDGYESPQIGSALDAKGIAVRAGHHCAQPILRRFGVEATVRLSFAFYNTCAEIDRMIDAVDQLARAHR